MAIPMTTPKEALITTSLLVTALIAGAWTDRMGWALWFATLVWIAIQARQYRKVAKWANRPLRRPRNVSDHWFVLAYNPFRALIRQRDRAHRMAEQMREIVSLAQVIPDGIIIVSPTGNIVTFNQAAKQLLMLKEEDIGLGLATVVRTPDFVGFLRARSHEDPLEFTSPFDAQLTYEARRVPMDDGGAVIIVRDITTLNRLLTMRQNFIANVSHELRTPLTVVHGYLETMSDESQPDELRLELISKLEGPMKRMRSLVEDLLLLSQLESTPAPEQKDVLPVAALAKNAAAEVQGLCQRPDQITVECDTSSQVEGIEQEIHSVLVNLLSNALRYSPDGGDVVLRCEDIADDRVRFSVKDHGIGIAPEHLARITERFYRVDMAAARGKGGTGLGLAIAKHVLRRHDASLQVQSTLGAGSTFYFELMRAPAKLTSNHQSVANQEE